MKFDFRFTQYLILFSLILVGCQRKVENKLVTDTDTNVSSNDSICWVKCNTKTAIKNIESFIIDPSTRYLHGAILLKNQQEFISIAEPILFSVFGKETIIEERPYQINLIGDFWYLEGTNPWDRGGFFCIVINRRTCEVMGINYGK